MSYLEYAMIIRELQHFKTVYTVQCLLLERFLLQCLHLVFKLCNLFLRTQFLCVQCRHLAAQLCDSAVEVLLVMCQRQHGLPVIWSQSHNIRSGCRQSHAPEGAGDYRFSQWVHPGRTHCENLNISLPNNIITCR